MTTEEQLAIVRERLIEIAKAKCKDVYKDLEESVRDAHPDPISTGEWMRNMDRSIKVKEIYTELVDNSLKIFAEAFELPYESLRERVKSSLDDITKQKEFP